MKGYLEVAGYYSGTLKEGYAFKIEGEQAYFLENKGKFHAIYIIAGATQRAVITKFV